MLFTVFEYSDVVYFDDVALLVLDYEAESSSLSELLSSESSLSSLSSSSEDSFLVVTLCEVFVGCEVYEGEEEGYGCCRDLIEVWVD